MRVGQADPLGGLSLGVKRRIESRVADRILRSAWSQAEGLPASLPNWIWLQIYDYIHFIGGTVW